MTYKNSFVEENPYITYTGEPETSFDGDSGGSGGELEPGSVTTEAIANGAVTAEKIAEGVTDSVYWIMLTCDPPISNWYINSIYGTENITPDKTLSDLISAIENGKNPKLKVLLTTGDISERNPPTYAVFDLKNIIYSASETGVLGAHFEYSYCDYDYTYVVYDIWFGLPMEGDDFSGKKSVYNFQPSEEDD